MTLKKSLEFIQENVDDLTDRLNALTHVDKHLTNQITLAAEENIVNHEGRLDYQEDQSRRKTYIFPDYPRKRRRHGRDAR